MNAREVMKLLHEDGWRKVAQKGSHAQLQHPEKPGKVTVPVHPGDIALPTLKLIERQAGLKLRK